MNPHGDPAALPASLSLYRGGEHPCAYLPGQTATDLFAIDSRIDSRLYADLMDLGFRRSGRAFYRPTCAGCSECVPIRVPVASFRPSASQTRVLRRNRDLTVEVAAPRADDERYALYAAYVAGRHDRGAACDREDFERFLYASPIDTVEFAYRMEGRLVGAGIVDLTPRCLSSVYFYYDPALSRRSLGVFSALCEIDECRRRGLPYWYVGFYIRDCRRMNYKADYRPCELLTPNGWRDFDAVTAVAALDGPNGMASNDNFDGSGLNNRPGQGAPLCDPDEGGVE